MCTALSLTVDDDEDEVVVVVRSLMTVVVVSLFVDVVNTEEFIGKRLLSVKLLLSLSITFNDIGLNPLTGSVIVVATVSA